MNGRKVILSIHEIFVTKKDQVCYDPKFKDEELGEDIEEPTDPETGHYDYLKESEQLVTLTMHGDGLKVHIDDKLGICHPDLQEYVF